MVRAMVLHAALLLWLVVSDACASILVIAPHPDDEALMFAGIIASAIQRQEEVKLVVMTNGDLQGVNVGYVRQAETVAAMVGVLGMKESDILFFGYPDGGLRYIFDSCPTDNDVHISAAGQALTYGNRGNGSSDYHTARFGIRGRYNRPSIVQDLQTVIAEYRPQHIYVTSEFDTHLDHSATYYFLRAALSMLTMDYPSYRPIIHKTLIHAGNDAVWPKGPAADLPFDEFPLLPLTPLTWGSRESIGVPQAMQSPITEQNMKALAIASYASQKGLYMFRFVHRDEIFWIEDLYTGNKPPTANAGADQSVSVGTTVSLSGLASSDDTNAPLTYLWIQLQGYPVVLSGRTAATTSFTAPAESDKLVFQLIVTDGMTSSYPAKVTITVNNPNIISQFFLSLKKRFVSAVRNSIFYRLFA